MRKPIRAGVGGYILILILLQLAIGLFLVVLIAVAKRILIVAQVCRLTPGRWYSRVYRRLGRLLRSSLLLFAVASGESSRRSGMHAVGGGWKGW